MRMLTVAGLAFAASTAAYGQTDFVAFCTGISVGPGGNRMYFSRPFVIAQNSAPPGGQLSDPNPADAFSAEVKARAGQNLIGASCPTRPTEAELTEFATSTQSSNSANWTIETIEWRPKGARRLGEAAVAEDKAAPANAQSRSEAAERRAAERAEAVARAQAEARAREQAEADALRAANAREAGAADAQRREIEAQKARYQAAQQDYEAKQRTFEERQRAFIEAKARHDAQVRASEDAYKQWEADVAACKSGNRSRCAKPSP